jgi:hypothetical protein
MAFLHSSGKSVAGSQPLAAWANGGASLPPSTPDLPLLVRVKRTLHALSKSLLVRALVPAVFLACHLAAMGKLGEERFGLPFDAAPGSPPTFVSPGTESGPVTWNRLVVSRWDSQHYIAIALRGYRYCAPRAAFNATRHPDDDIACELNFFPGYAFVGRWAAALTHAPMDYALLGVSLVASWILMFLWTGEELTSAMGPAVTWLSLVYLNVFTTGYALATIQTEPLALCLTMVAFVCLQRRYYLLGAFAAGAASIVRPTGVAISFAFAFGLFVATIRERPRALTVAWRFCLMALAGWGLASFLLFCQVRFGDALVYSHARTRYYHYAPSFSALLHPSHRWIAESIWAGPNEGMWLAAGLVWFALGHRKALRGFTFDAQAFWYALFVTCVGIAAVGQVEIAFSGMGRYLLLALPLFFATAAVTKGHPLAIGIWILLCAMHYWCVNSCFFIGHGMPNYLSACNIQRGS